MNTELVSFPMHDVTAHGILDEKNRDTLHVQWILTQACNSRCSYCTQWSEMGNTVYVKERVLEIAYKILADRRPYYAFTFTGGEPTLHPHLTDILAYLYRSHTPLGVVVETNGLRNLDYYKELVEIAPKHTLRLTISAHLEKIALKDLCFLIAMTAEHKQHAHVRLILDPNQRKKVRVFYDTLMKLRAVTPFTLDLWLLTRTENPLELDGRYTETDFSWYEDAQKRFDEITTTSPLSLPPLLPPVIPQFRYLTETKDVAWCDQEDTDLELEFKDFYCCLGTNFLRVSSDGTFQGALCCQARPQQPLWKETSHTSQTLKILQCASPCCVEERNAVLPKFRQKKEAEDWVRDFEERRTAQKWEAAPLPHPVHPEPSLEDKVRIRLKRMQPENVSSPQGTPQSETIRQRFTDICTIYAALADEDSKEIFLRRIKFLETGDAGYTLLSAYSAGEHPEMPIYPEDEAFLETGTGYFRLLHLGGTTDNLALLTEQEKRIAYYQPKMRIALTAPEWCLDIPLHILEKYKGYTLLIGQHGTEANETWLYAIPPVLPKRYPVIPEELADKLPLVSVIVPTHNNEDTLKRCLDSALIQGIERMELIIIDDASTDKTPEIIAEYVRRYPKIVRTLRFAENKGPGPARNAGMDMAYGQYMTFIDSDDMLAEDFLKRGLEVMEKEDADIVAFDMVMNRDGEEVLWGVEPGTWAGESSLRQFLLKKTGCYGTYCCIYKVSMIHHYIIEYSDTAVHQDMFFSIRAFYYSKKTIVLQHIGYYRYFRKESNSNKNYGDKKFIAFISIVNFLTQFFYAHDINTESDMYCYCIQKIYEWDRDILFRAIFEADKNSKVYELLTKENLLKLSSSKEAISCILKDYSLLYCKQKNLNPKVYVKDINWKNDINKGLQKKSFHLYKNKNFQKESNPLISAIIANYNKEKYIKRCLDSILLQNMQDFEIIIIDDASTDNSFNILKDYADEYKNIRLYKMDSNSRQGICQNIGIKLSKGNYITFIDSDDYILNDFFSTVKNQIESLDSDVIVFSTCDIEENGNIIERRVSPIELPGDKTLNYYLTGGFPPSMHGKVFKKSFLIENKILFPEYVYYEDQYFIGNIMSHSASVTFYNKIVYISLLLSNSIMRPKSMKYLHIHSAYLFYNFLYNISRINTNNYIKRLNISHISWNIENILLPACKAFYDTCGEIPISKNDFYILKNNFIFLYHVLLGYAKLRNQCPIDNSILPIYHQPDYKNFKYNFYLKPIISIIIPTYNQEECIERCIKSITTQSLRNIEIIIINDGSTDNTLSQCLAWKELDSRIQIIDNGKNMGQGYSRNKALKKAKGKYITYIDSDDYILPNFLLHGVSILEHNKEVDFIHFNSIRKKDNGEILKFDKDNACLCTGFEALNKYCKRETMALGIWSNIYRHSFLNENTINFPDSIMFEDIIFILNTLKKANFILFINEYGYIYVQHKHYASAENFIKVTQRRITGIFSSAKLIHDFFYENFSYKEAKELIYNKCDSPMWQLKRSLSDIATSKDAITSPLSDKNMEDLAASPEFLRRILNDYASLYSMHTQYIPILPSEDLDPEYKNIKPTDYLVPFPFYKKQKNIIISVIIPAYNVASYLSRCLNSILSQNFKEMEIILVEDCSNQDDTFSICKQYAQKYSNIHLFQTQWNSGLGTVRNLAIQEASGKYITFVDSDDWMAPNFLRKSIYLILEESKFEVAEFSYYDWDDISNAQIAFNRMPHGYKISSNKALEIYIHNTFKNHGAWAKIYNKSYLIKNNILFGTNFNEDESFLLKLYMNASNVIFYDIPSYFYVRKSKTNTIMNPLCRGKKYFESTLGNLKIVNNLLNNNESNIKNYKRKIKSYSWCHHRDNIFYYIHACNILGKPSPLTDEVIHILTQSKDYLRNLIMDYAILSQEHFSKPLENK